MYSTPIVEILAKPKNNETPKEGIHWRLLPREFKVKAVVLNGAPGTKPLPAFPNDIIGDYETVYMTLLDTDMTIEWEEKECANLDGVNTPPTPP